VPDVPDVPSIPLVPAVPDVPLVPEVPSIPLVPDVPDTSPKPLASTFLVTSLYTNTVSDVEPVVGKFKNKLPLTPKLPLTNKLALITLS
jgi:hypothetical protein